MIKLDKVSIIFGQDTPLETIALNEMELKINNNEFVSVIGSNGAGKSTLLNTISGIYPPNSGDIYIDDKHMNFKPVHKRANLVSRVFQDPLSGTCEDLTIEENFALSSSRGLTRSLRPAINNKKRAYFKEQLSILGLGLENRLEDKISLLSGGQRQALSLLMSASNPMKIFLLDEHTAALDPKIANFILNLTQKIIKEKQLTTLMVTHSMKQAIDYGNRLIMLHKGKVVFDIKEKEKKKLTIKHLLDMFENIDEDLASDELLFN
jgi:putative ABC transport system ATP-binding protein